MKTKKQKHGKKKEKIRFRNNKKMPKKAKGKGQQRDLQNKPKIRSGLSRKKLEAMPLRERMMEKLKSSRFRFINEEFYSMRGNDAMQYFKKEPKAFEEYHTGYQKQVAQWPVDPLDVIIEELKRDSKCTAESVIADFGCGTARLAKALPKFKVHSFDLVALDPLTTVCDMASTSLPSASVDYVVCCLSLMGTNFADYIKEANRILKVGGMLKIAEVESRFDDVDGFLESLIKFGFKVITRDYAHQLFYFFSLRKESNIGKKTKKKMPELTLKPCLYKKR